MNKIFHTYDHNSYKNVTLTLTSRNGVPLTVNVRLIERGVFHEVTVGLLGRESVTLLLCHPKRRHLKNLSLRSHVIFKTILKRTVSMDYRGISECSYPCILFLYLYIQSREMLIIIITTTIIKEKNSDFFTLYRCNNNGSMGYPDAGG